MERMLGRAHLPVRNLIIAEEPKTWVNGSMDTWKTMEIKMILVAVRPPKSCWVKHLIRKEELQAYKEKWLKEGSIYRFAQYPA